MSVDPTLVLAVAGMIAAGWYLASWWKPRDRLRQSKRDRQAAQGQRPRKR